jgi:hypothetical protein
MRWVLYWCSNQVAVAILLKNLPIPSHCLGAGTPGMLAITQYGQTVVVARTITRFSNNIAAVYEQ